MQLELLRDRITNMSKVSQWQKIILVVCFIILIVTVIIYFSIQTKKITPTVLPLPNSLFKTDINSVIENRVTDKAYNDIFALNYPIYKIVSSKSVNLETELPKFLRLDSSGINVTDTSFSYWVKPISYTKITDMNDRVNTVISLFEKNLDMKFDLISKPICAKDSMGEYEILENDCEIIKINITPVFSGLNKFLPTPQILEIAMTKDQVYSINSSSPILKTHELTSKVKEKYTYSDISTSLINDSYTLNTIDILNIIVDQIEVNYFEIDGAFYPFVHFYNVEGYGVYLRI